MEKKEKKEKKKKKVNQKIEDEEGLSLTQRYNSLSREEQENFDNFVDDLFTNRTTLDKVTKKKGKKNIFKDNNFFDKLLSNDNNIKYIYLFLFGFIFIITIIIFYYSL